MGGTCTWCYPLIITSDSAGRLQIREQYVLVCRLRPGGGEGKAETIVLPPWHILSCAHTDKQQDTIAQSERTAAHPHGALIIIHTKPLCLLQLEWLSLIATASLNTGREALSLGPGKPLFSLFSLSHLHFCPLSPISWFPPSCRETKTHAAARDADRKRLVMCGLF